MQWNLQELCGAVQQLYGVEQRQLLAPCLRSIEERFGIAHYHYWEAKDLMRHAIGEREDHQVLEDLMFQGDEEAAEQFHSARWKAAAHTIACLQSLHTVADTFAHVLYYALGMNLDPVIQLTERQVSLWRVSNSIKILPDAIRIATLIDEFRSGDDYEYLDAVVNHSKHRSIVDVGYGFNFEEISRKPHGLRLQSFVYDRKSYPQRWMEEVLEGEYNRQGRLRIGLGCEVNKVVLQRRDVAASPPA